MTQTPQPIPQAEDAAERARAARGTRATWAVLCLAVTAGVAALLACWESTWWGGPIAVFAGIGTGFVILPGSLPLLFRLEKEPLRWLDTALALALFAAALWWVVSIWPQHVGYRGALCVGLAMVWVFASALAAFDAFTQGARRCLRHPVEAAIGVVAVGATLGAAGWVVAARWIADGGEWWQNPLNLGLGFATLGAVGGQMGFFLRDDPERCPPWRRLVGLIVSLGAAVWVGRWLWDDGWLQRAGALLAAWLAYLAGVAAFVPPSETESEQQ